MVRPFVALFAALLIVAAPAVGRAAPITIDSFPDSTVLGSSGISQSAIGSQNYGPETGLTGVVGGSRSGTLELTADSSQNPGVGLQIAGGSGQLKYDSNNKDGNDGLFTLFYDGNGGATPFPLNLLTGTSVDFDIQSHTNNDQQTTPSTLFTILFTETAGAGGDTFSFFGSTGQQNGLFSVPFGAIPGNFDLSSVASILITVDPSEGTNIALRSITTQGTVGGNNGNNNNNNNNNNNGGVNGGVNGNPIPEPGTLLVWSVLGIGGLIGSGSLRRRPAASAAK